MSPAMTSYWQRVAGRIARDVAQATGNLTITIAFAHRSTVLWDAYARGWLGWAGPPDLFETDSERSSISLEFLDKLGESGTQHDSAAQYGPWQKENGERKIKAAAYVANERESRESVALTYGMISFVDDAIGRILNKLKQLPHLILLIRKQFLVLMQVRISPLFLLSFEQLS